MNIDTIRTDRLLTCRAAVKLCVFHEQCQRWATSPTCRTFECRLCRLAVTAEQVFGITEMLSL
jgi:hypothetical protein